MLQVIRDRLSGPIMWVMIIVVIVSFGILFGIQGFLTGTTDPVLVKVGDEKITQSQFQTEYQQYYRRLQQLQGENFRPDLIDADKTRDTVLKGMIDRLVLDQYTRKQGYRLDDAALLEYLDTIPQFQADGKFSKERYLESLRQYNLTPDAYEAQERGQLAKEQLRDAVLDSAFISPQELAQGWRLAHQLRGFEYVKLDTAKHLPLTNVTDDEVKKRYEERKAGYQAPERIKLSYLELVLADMPPVPAPSQDDLRAIYEKQKASLFTSPEERRASHILLQFGADKTAAKAKAQSLYDKLKAGADFATLAKDNSDDTRSKLKGGDLGWNKRGGALQPELEEALFGLAPGAYTEPLDTKFGWDILKLDEVKPAVTQPFEDAAVQKQLIDLNQRKVSALRFQDELKQLDQLSFENPTALDVAAKALNLTPKSTDWLTRAGGDGIAANDAVLAAAFSREVAEEGNNSKPIELEPGHVVVIRKAEYEAARPLELKEVSDRIRDELKAEKALARMTADATDLVTAVKSGQTLDAAAKAKGLAVAVQAPVTRDAKDADRALLDAVFKMPRASSVDKTSVTQTGLADGSLAVIALTTVTDGGPPDAANPDLARTKTQIEGAEAGAELEAFRGQMEKEIDITRETTPNTEDKGVSP